MDNFRGSGRPLTKAVFDEICGSLEVTGPQMWAVVTVETRGFGYLPSRKPLILFERHVFHRQTGGTFSAGHPDISNPVRGGYLGGEAEYQRLGKAIALNEEAALRSASWGLGQVMGFNCSKCGCERVSDFVSQMVADENGQLKAVLQFMASEGLNRAMREEAWETFARRYNGASFRDNQYDVRLAAAHAKAKILMPDFTYRTAQAALTYLGIDPGPVDGYRGRRTRAALADFQQSRRLPSTGEPDTATLDKLFAEVFPEADSARA